jgi:hypothetical protein
MACFAGIQGCLLGQLKGAERKGTSSWSKSPSAAAKVHLDMIWEVPPQEEDAKLVSRPDFAVAKYSKIKPLNAALLDSYIHGFQRTTTLFFGRIVSNPDDLPAFQEPLGYNMTYNAMATGNGNALHRHNSVEIFVALDAPFEIAYGSKGEFKAQLQPWDLVACPAEAIHSYKNMGEDGGQILTFLCGKPAITWAPGVVNDARKNGAICDDSGILLAHSSAKKAPPMMTFEAAESMLTASRQSTVDSMASQETSATEADLAQAVERRQALQAMDAEELILKAGALDNFVYRYSDRSRRSLQVSSSAGFMRIYWVDLAPGRAHSPEGDEDTLVIVLGGSVICEGRHYTHLDVIKQPIFTTAGAQGATLLVTRSTLPHNLNFFFDADITAS